MEQCVPTHPLTLTIPTPSHIFFVNTLTQQYLGHHVSVAAPEVLRGEEYSHSVDWWSLGIIVYSLLAGRVSEWVSHIFFCFFHFFQYVLLML